MDGVLDLWRAEMRKRRFDCTSFDGPRKERCTATASVINARPGEKERVLHTRTDLGI